MAWSEQCSITESDGQQYSPEIKGIFDDLIAVESSEYKIPPNATF